MRDGLMTRGNLKGILWILCFEPCYAVLDSFMIKVFEVRNLCAAPYYQ